MKNVPELDCLADAAGNLLVKGCAVSAEAEPPFVVEGNVLHLLPFAADWADPSWTRGTVVIQDHETGLISLWNPELVYRVDTR